MDFGGYVAEYSGVIVIGGAVGFSELVSRYKDQPYAAASTRAGLLYVAINAAASAAALGLILTYGWNLGATGDGVAATRILVAGFAAMALFRSSLFTVRIGNSDIGVGPSTFLSLILGACDRSVDRKRAEDRAKMAWDVMSDVDYLKAHVNLTTVALALMQNLSDQDQALLATQLKRISDDKDISSHAKSLALGLALSTAVGPSVLAEAKHALGDDILRDPGNTPPPRPPTPTVAETDIQDPPSPRGAPATPQTPSGPEGP